MSTVAKEKLADIVTLSPEEMREIMLGIHEALEDIEDAQAVLSARAALACGEEEALDWNAVKKELSL